MPTSPTQPGRDGRVVTNRSTRCLRRALPATVVAVVAGVLAAACGSAANSPAVTDSGTGPTAARTLEQGSGQVTSGPPEPTRPAPTAASTPTSTSTSTRAESAPSIATATVVATATPGAISTANATSTGNATSTATATSTDGSPAPGRGARLPADFAPTSFSATSTDRWFVLGTDGRNRVRLLTTADGGSSWGAVVLPDAARGPVGGQDRPAVAFSDSTHGLVAAGGGFWATADGGRTWRTGGPANAEVLEVAAGPGAGYVLLHTAAGGYFLGRADAGAVDLRQALGGDRFTDTVPHLATSGATVAVVSGDRTLRSTDGGRTFDSVRGPCAADLGGRVSAAGATVLAWCATGSQGQGFVSTDRGATFTRTDASGSNSVVAAPTGSGAGFVYGGPTGLRVTGGSGTGTAARGGIGTVLWVGFSTPRRGFAIAAGDASGGTGTDGLWRSVDGGRTWAPVGAGAGR